MKDAFPKGPCMHVVYKFPCASCKFACSVGETSPHFSTCARALIFRHIFSCPYGICRVQSLVEHQVHQIVSRSWTLWLLSLRLNLKNLCIHIKWEKPEGVNCRLQVAGAGCRLQVAGCRCRLQVAGCRCRLQVVGAGCRLQVAGCRLQVAGCR